MKYDGVYPNKFLKEARKLGTIEKERIVRCVDKVLSNPYRGIPLVGDLKGLWKWRMGAYRIVYEIDEEHKIVRFLRVGPRKTAYRF